MNYYLFLLPLFTALVAWLSTLIFLYAFVRWVIPKKQIPLQQALVQLLRGSIDLKPVLLKMEALDFESELGPLIDRRLDHLIDQFKPLVPMGEVLLSGSLAIRLKKRAKEEFLEAIPEIKSCLVNKIERDFNFNQIIGELLQEIDCSQIPSILASETKGEIAKLKGLSALVGFILGMIGLALFLFFC